MNTFESVSVFPDKLASVPAAPERETIRNGKPISFDFFSQEVNALVLSLGLESNQYTPEGVLQNLTGFLDHVNQHGYVNDDGHVADFNLMDMLRAAQSEYAVDDSTGKFALVSLLDKALLENIDTDEKEKINISLEQFNDSANTLIENLFQNLDKYSPGQIKQQLQDLFATVNTNNSGDTFGIMDLLDVSNAAYTKEDNYSGDIAVMAILEKALRA